MKKTLIYIGIGAVAVIAAAIGIIYFASGNKPVEVKIDPDFEKYISAYTTGIVSKNSTVQVKLNSQALTGVETTGDVNQDLFDFSPGIKGKVYWANSNTLEFQPKEPLPPDTHFEVNFNLGDLINVPDKLETLTFYFQTIKQNFDVSIEQQKTIDLKTLKWQKAIGLIKLADFEEFEKVKKVLSATQNGRDLKIKWLSGSDDDFEYSFEIDSISRTKEASTVKVQWNGKSLEVDNKGSLELTIPSLDDFVFISSKVIQNPEQYLLLHFSDPLKTNQQLDGYVNIEGISAVKYIIEDNTIRVYPPERLNGSYNVVVGNGIKNVLGYKLKRQENLNIAFEELKPAIRLIGEGVIMPLSTESLVFPFEAVSLKKVDVEIIRIYESNVVQFLQVNNFNGSSQLKRVGHPVVRKTVELDESNLLDLGQWNRFTLNLKDLINAEPGAMYRIKLGFRKCHSVYNCENSDVEENNESDNRDLQDMEYNWSPDSYESSYWDYDYYYYNWEYRDDPCHRSYYGSRRTVSQNIFASNIGLIAKKGVDGSVDVFATDLITAQPLQGVTVEVLNYQNQVLGTKASDINGVAKFSGLKDPYFIVAQQDKQRGYLKLSDGTSLSLSRFDVSGTTVQKGLKGFIYGERGVWRPGDSLFLTFILEEGLEPLPEKHPIVCEIKNPLGQLAYRFVQQKNNTGFYSFNFKTGDDAPTGDWYATIQAGGVTFTKNLKIETIKPNRLKINFDFDKEFLTASETPSAEMSVKWLHGAIARNLDAEVKVILNPANTTFTKYEDYEFDDPTKEFQTEALTIFDGKIDDVGTATVHGDISTESEPPGKLNATFVTNVYEAGGNASVDKFTMPYYPYSSFVGVKLPKGDKARGMLLTDTTHKVELIVLDAEGKPVKSGHTIEMEFYKISWRWWWDQSANDLASYSARSSFTSLKKGKVFSKNGKATWSIRVAYPDWGRYLVRARDLTSGHSTAKVVYIDWPGWAGREQKSHGEGAAMLTFTSDKNKYNVGEKINLSIPTSEGSRALVSVETGSKVIESHWVTGQDAETSFTLTASKEMSPNAYINITLLQPHDQTANDLPIRMYGVIPVMVEDQATHLHPEIKMPEIIRPEEVFDVTVSEENNKEMTYTLAIVDEGLLDLTRFKTPDPWNTFYAREALGVKTWDIYDYVIGAYGVKLERLLSIGGDEEMGEQKGRKANRFDPVVKFLGPFHLKNGKQTHSIKMPRYVGAVRTMVIAGNKGAYGSVEKSSKVRKPLMVLATLPRVLGPGESVSLPVTVFAMENNIKNVNILVKPNKFLRLSGDSKRSVTFSEPGDKTIDFDIEVLKQPGVAEVEVIATSGKEKATYKIELEVRNPNPKVTDVIAAVIEAGQSWKTPFEAIGISGTNKGVLEISSIPPMNLEKRLNFLVTYPHGCIEQTTSAAFPQLYVDRFIQLDKDKKQEISRNVKAAIQRIGTFQLYNGGFGYWPNSSDVCEWGTNYAGHFLLEAKNKGYNVSSNLLLNWRKYQKQKARKWVDDGKASQLEQAYRLYTLALAGKSEIGAMNRLREKSNLSTQTKWRLAAAYYLAGKKKTAEKLVQNLNTEIPEYKELSYTYGSDVRDKAMILETLSLMNKRKESFNLVAEISKVLGSERWCSTQTTAYSLIAVSRYVGSDKTSSSLKYSYQVDNGSKKSESTRNPVSLVNIPVKTSGGNISVKNTSGNVLYARLLLEGIPRIGETTDAENDLKMKISYKLMDGTTINPVKLEQGTDFIAEIKLTNPGRRGAYKEMALNQVFPSGWEIINTRFLGTGNVTASSIPDYQDIRDDRVYTYFDLNAYSSKTFVVLLNAGYTGKYYLPTVYSEAMYDASINARQHGQWVEVYKAGEL